MFQILDRDGFTKGAQGEIIPNGTPQSPPAEESGWKDTALSYPGEVLTLVAKWEARWDTTKKEDCTTDPVTLVTSCGYQGNVLATAPATTVPSRYRVNADSTGTPR